MGTGIGIYCERCNEQLDYEIGFVLKKNGYDSDLCDKCYHIIEFEKNLKKL